MPSPCGLFFDTFLWQVDNGGLSEDDSRLYFRQILMGELLCACSLDSPLFMAVP